MNSKLNKFFYSNCIDNIVQVYMRKYVKCSNSSNKIIFHIRKIFLNKFGFKYGFEIPPKVLPKSTIIYHQNIVINSFAIIGNNVKFHGNNCIGNNGKNTKAPKIGNNVDIGFGAIVIGNVEIADDCVIGANAVVTHSFLEKGSIIIGNPARKLK